MVAINRTNNGMERSGIDNATRGELASKVNNGQNNSSDTSKVNGSSKGKSIQDIVEINGKKNPASVSIQVEQKLTEQSSANGSDNENGKVEKKENKPLADIKAKTKTDNARETSSSEERRKEAVKEEDRRDREDNIRVRQTENSQPAKKGQVINTIV